MEGTCPVNLPAAFVEDDGLVVDTGGHVFDGGLVVD